MIINLNKVFKKIFHHTILQKKMQKAIDKMRTTGVFKNDAPNNTRKIWPKCSQ